MLHCWNPLYNAGWSINQEEYHPLLYIETHFFRNLLVTSFRELTKTSRTFQKILDYSRSFWILLDPSPTQRSSPEGSLVHAQVHPGLQYRHIKCRANIGASQYKHNVDALSLVTTMGWMPNRCALVMHMSQS